MPRFALTMAKQLLGALRDLAPIVAVIVLFQVVALQQPFPDVANVVVGLVCVVLGLALFIQGLESGLFPLGEALAQGMARKGERDGVAGAGLLPRLRHHRGRAGADRRGGRGG